MKTITLPMNSKILFWKSLVIFAISVMTASAQTLIKYEAESAQLNGVTVASSANGYSGTGYIDAASFDATNDNVTFTVSAPSAGTYPLVIRYGGFNGDKTQTIVVNGTTISNCATNFLASSVFTDFNFGVITLNAGNNTIQIVKCFGWMAIDYITIGTTATSGSNNGTGLKGEYFGNISLTAPVALTRTDATVNFDWASGGPGSPLGSDTYSVRWTGQVEAPVSGSYTFSTTSDDGVRLTVSGVQLINNWTVHGSVTDNGTAINLIAGQKYNITMEYYENAGLAVAKLLWAYPGQAQQVIPQTRLYPAANTNVAVTSVSVTPTSATLNVSTSLSLTATISPSNATNKNVSWSSNNTAVASVSGSGVVTGIAPGTASITVTTQDGGKTATSVITVTQVSSVMTAGTQFWNIGWESPSNYFASGVNWATTTNPWNPTFISELQEAKIKTLRFMDWNNTNASSVINWSQRIPKTANHYNVNNTVVGFRDNYDWTTNTHTLVADAEIGYGVAYEWQIDLCNRIGADMWINIPIQASADYQIQLANLIKNNLNANLKVYIEYSNETWNTSFCTWVYAYQRALALGLNNLNYGGAYVEPWWAYKVYASVRVFQNFETVFGTNSSRIVKVLGGQVGYHWDGTNYNHQTLGDLAVLANTTVNPSGITVNAYAVAPYMGGQTLTEEYNAIAGDVQGVIYVKNSLVGKSIKVVCYEGGADNWPDNTLTLTRDAAQQSTYVHYLTELAKVVEGPFNQYTFYGGCWGLKNVVGESASIAPKWRGWIDYWANGIRGRSASEESTIQYSTSHAFSLYPNPATSIVTVNVGSGAASIKLLNNLGVEVLSITPQNGENQVNLSNMSSGLYTVLVLYSNAKTESLRLIIK